MRALLAAALLLGTIITTAQADVYKCPNGKGGTVFQDMPCQADGGAQLNIPTGPMMSYVPPPMAPAVALPDTSAPARHVKILEFGKAVDRIEFGTWVLQGVVRNTSRAELAQWVKVSVQASNSRGDLVGIETAYVEPYHLGPGQEGTYTVRFPKGAKVERYKTSMAWR